MDDVAAPPLTKAEERLIRVERQRVDADKVRSEMAAAAIARDAKTIRLRALRLAKEEADREAASLVVKKPRRKVAKAAAPTE
ncbi:hypothetical protein P7D22_17550 [Lichenihabitans sp. Uapishka_5]|uniref:hypothetical protein n=1 Tax=Lichenihabitans sp. Uapishka_5 TaxID=3037302 RepID=UPI0029E7D97D|nr:hypothetical protein [Lichenihabitans sp. Uapishka_5]MDX7952971.1 hypothetical protein [Lichenihabitans sp. Uapishka_5]